MGLTLESFGKVDTNDFAFRGSHAFKCSQATLRSTVLEKFRTQIHKRISRRIDELKWLRAIRASLGMWYVEGARRRLPSR